ncbi:unnamed protein product [Symbiodinium sp. CCMP2592]|nr:unnamed protein product [Symbiodinium sp. CCMP2592]
MAVLWEGWVQCQGNWHSSELLLTLQSSRKNKRRGARRWMTVKELVDRYGQEVADEVVEYKSRDPVLRKTQIKCHPDCPRLMLYLCFDFECEEEEEEDILGYMASAVYRDGGHEEGGRSRKRKHESEAESDSSESSSSSSSEEKRSKKKKKKDKKDKKDKKKQGGKKPTAEQLERKAAEEKKKEQEKEERRQERQNLKEEKQRDRELERKRQTIVKDAKKADEIGKLVGDAKKKMSEFGKFMRDMQ